MAIRPLSLAPRTRFKRRTSSMAWGHVKIGGVFGYESVNSIKAVKVSRITFKNSSYDFGCQPIIVTQQMNGIELG